MKRILVSILAAAIMAPVAAHAGDFIAKRLQDDGSIIGLTSVPCDGEPGHKALIAKGNWMGAGCYLVMPDGSVNVRWIWKKDPLDAYQRIEPAQLQPVGDFKGWPAVDWSKQAPLSPKGNRG
ncbi:hypothetical protein [Bordetella phage vB_BbrM_PHB04]|uniref:Uncharacterized protein n=1 Tax=Bordetella phage vB_BbrM_PHB04 TaxID=2029657 RepID=A0A291LA39_9CAUD|nr:hypothetical protein HOS14_gp046 [Bordetella phage vB_BbrM_PHB04]ATI15664.1 hypothetical protein [Bordetella phage vB_BbrM_PHB04]